MRKWVNGTAKLCRPHENDLIAPALEPNRVHDDPQIVGGADSDAQQMSNNGRVRTWTRNKAEIKRMGAFCLFDNNWSR